MVGMPWGSICHRSELRDIERAQARPTEGSRGHQGDVIVVGSVIPVQTLPTA
jgi:hypothetical protein